jgi:hypothetical protein
MKKSRKIINRKALGLLFMMVMMISIPLISALELNPFADSKEYSKIITPDMSDFIKADMNEEYGVITLTSNFLWLGTGKVAEYSLTKNTKLCMINCEAEGKIKLYSDGVLFDDVKFKTLTGQDTSIVSSKYYILDGYLDNYIEVPDAYKEECVEIINKNGTTEECSQVVDTYRKENQPVENWIEYNGEQLRAGEYQWKIKGTKEQSQSIDFIPVVYSKEFNEWAYWIGVTPTVYWKLNSNLLDTIGVKNLTSANGVLVNDGKLSGGINGTYNGTLATVSGGSQFNFSLVNFTVAFWMKDNNKVAGRHEWIIDNMNGWVTTGGWSIALPGDAPAHNLKWVINGGGCAGGDICSTTSQLNDSRWKRIVIVREGTGANLFKMYINGTLDKTSTLSNNLFLQATTVNIGKQAGLTSYWNGTLDDIQIFNGYAWTSADVTADYNGGAGKEADASQPLMSIVNSIPINYINISSSSITFGCNATSTLQNITSIVLSVTNGINWTQTNTYTGSNMSVNATFTNSTLADGTYNWNCTAYGNQGINASATAWVLNKDTIAPTLSLTLPTGDYYTNNQSINFSATDGGVGLETCWYTLNGGVKNNTLDGCTNNTLNLYTGNNTVTLYANDSVGNIATPVTKYAYLYPTINICNTSVNVSFMNFTFADEISLAYLNASLSSSSITYYADANKPRTYTFSNTTANRAYNICKLYNEKDITTNSSLVAYQTGYPTRYFTSDDVNVNNTRTNKTIYLLGSADGVYQTIIVITGSSSVITGATVSASLAGLGVIDERTTDSSGTVQLWLNPNFAHTLTTSHPSYTSVIQVINPVSSPTLYVTLGESPTFPENISITYTEGVTWSILPSDEYLLNDTNYPANFTVTAGTYTIDEFGFHIYDEDGNILSEDTVTDVNGGTILGSIATESHTTITLVGYWISNGTTNTVNRIWSVLNNSETDYSIAFLGTRFKTYITSGIFGLKTGFGLNLLCFIIVLVATGLVSYKFGLDNPTLVATIAVLLFGFFEFGLGLIDMGGGIPLTIWATLVLVGLFIKEGLT